MSLHADIRTEARGFIVWCHDWKRWAPVVLGYCSACGADIQDRFKDAA